MYFFKNTAGNWIIGPELTSFKSKVASELIRNTPTNVSVRTIEKKVYLVERTEVTTIKKNAAGDFYANYAEFLTAVSDFFDNAPLYGAVIEDVMTDLLLTKQNKIISVNTFAELIPQATGEDYKQFLVLIDETNNNEKTRYDWDGDSINWIITQKIN